MSLGFHEEKDKGKKKKSQGRLTEKIYSGTPATSKGRIRGKIPYSRDGHSANLIGDFMVIFGGDRYQMPFNDIHLYTINENLLKM